MKTIEERAKEYAKGRRYEIVAYVAYIAGAIEQEDIDIDKACEWLRENASKHIHGQYSFLKGLMLEEFQQAMKGGEE